MPEQQLKKTLSELREELGDIDEIDPSLRALLEEVDGEIHELLESESREQDETDQLLARVEEIGAEFAARHPTTERFFQELMATLGRLGI